MSTRVTALIVGGAVALGACQGDDAVETTTRGSTTTTVAPATTSAGTTATPPSASVPTTVAVTDTVGEPSSTSAVPADTTSTSETQTTDAATSSTEPAADTGITLPALPIVDPDTGLEITDLNVYVADDGMTYWAAEMSNPTSMVLESPTADVIFYDAAGEEIDISGDFTGYVAPGATFALSGSIETGEAVTEVGAEAYADGTLEPGAVTWDLPTTVAEFATDPVTGVPTTRGQVTNPNSFDVETWIYVVYRAASGGHILDADFQAYTVPAGSTQDFEIASHKPAASEATVAEAYATWNGITELPS